jgi:hypothetical protein
VTIPAPAPAEPEPASGGGGPAVSGPMDVPGVEPTAPAFGPNTLVTLALAARRVPAKGPVKVRVANGNAFAVSGELSAARNRAKLRPRPFTAGAQGKTTVKLSLPKTLRKLLKRKHKLALRLVATLKDPEGNTRTVKKTVGPKLKRR